MDNKETIQSFNDMVNASQKIAKPWIIVCAALLVALVLTNAIWGYVHYKQIEFAYSDTTELTQEQYFDEHTQSQRYSDGVTNGD